jgi:hypothetical protein
LLRRTASYSQVPNLKRRERTNAFEGLQRQQQSDAGTAERFVSMAVQLRQSYGVPKKQALEGPMVRELELLAVTVVFMFLGACVMGVVH